MNRENVEFAIKLMKRAKNLNMLSFQSCGDYKACSVKDLHTCKNTACFVGYLSLTAQYRKFAKKHFSAPRGSKLTYSGDLIDKCGDVVQSEKLNEIAVSSNILAAFLGVSSLLALKFMYRTDHHEEPLYSVPFSNVRPEHIIEKLQAVLDGRLS